MMRWQGTGLTDRGNVRASNQDAFKINNTLQLWIVADGMGGHAGGGIASQIAVQTIMASVQESTSSMDEVSRQHHTMLQTAMESANTAIREEAHRRPELAGMGTTTILLWISSLPEPQATIAHIGDSRAYLLQQETMTQLSVDHSWIVEQIHQGVMNPEEAASHPMRHTLTRALGIEPTITPDIQTISLLPTDRLLLCTDGLNKMMNDEQIFEVLSSTSGTKEDHCHALINKANDLGGHDNITVVIVGQKGTR